VIDLFVLLAVTMGGFSLGVVFMRWAYTAALARKLAPRQTKPYRVSFYRNNGCWVICSATKAAANNAHDRVADRARALAALLTDDLNYDEPRYVVDSGFVFSRHGTDDLLVSYRQHERERELLIRSIVLEKLNNSERR